MINQTIFTLIVFCRKIFSSSSDWSHWQPGCRRSLVACWSHARPLCQGKSGSPPTENIIQIKKAWQRQQTHRQQQPNDQKTEYLAKKNPILDSLIEMMILQTKIEAICILISKLWSCKPPLWARCWNIEDSLVGQLTSANPPQWAGCEQGLDLVQGWCWSSQRRPTPPPSSPVNYVNHPRFAKILFEMIFIEK